MNLNGELMKVVLLSLFVSITATLIAALVGIVLAVPTALNSFRMKKFLTRLSETLMCTPPVLMGLIVYLLLSRKGPFGKMQILFTPTAMIIAQTLLVFPIVFGLSTSVISKYGQDVYKNCLALGASKREGYFYIIKECKNQLMAVVTTGFGRAISEVGAVMMVGGNIKGETRVMTTFIALETGKGNFSEALAIGVVLLLAAFMVNFILHSINDESVG